MIEIRKFLDEMRQTNAELKATVDELERKQNEELDQLRTQLQAANERIQKLEKVREAADCLPCRRDVESCDRDILDHLVYGVINAIEELEKETP